jgi:hypothetical protein
MQHIAPTLLFILSTLIPSAALAQLHGGPNGDAFFVSTTCSPFIGTTWLGGTTSDNLDLFTSSSQRGATGLLSLGVVLSVFGGLTTTVIVHQASKTSAILDHHEQELRVAITLGAGPMLDDLAIWLNLGAPAARRALGRILRRERVTLLAILDRPPGLQRGWDMLHHLHRVELELRRSFADAPRP